MQPLGCKVGEAGKKIIIMVAGNPQEQQKLSFLEVMDISYLIGSCQRIFISPNF